MKYAVKIGGMSCNHCKKSVYEALEGLTGACCINVEIGSAYLHAECNKDEITGAIEEIGFDVISLVVEE